MHCRCNLPIQYGVHRQGSWKLIYFDGSSNESSQERPSSPDQSGLPVEVAPRATSANSNQVNVVSESKVSDTDTRFAEIISLR